MYVPMQFNHRVAGEIKRSRDLRMREVELDPHFCPEEIMSREVELLQVVQVVRQQQCNGHCLSDSVQHSS